MVSQDQPGTNLEIVEIYFVFLCSVRAPEPVDITPSNVTALSDTQRQLAETCINKREILREEINFSAKTIHQGALSSHLPAQGDNCTAQYLGRHQLTFSKECKHLHSLCCLFLLIYEQVKKSKFIRSLSMIPMLHPKQQQQNLV